MTINVSAVIPETCWQRERRHTAPCRTIILSASVPGMTIEIMLFVFPSRDIVTDTPYLSSNMSLPVLQELFTHLPSRFGPSLSGPRWLVVPLMENTLY